MTLIRQEGPINQHTYLIDAVHRGIPRGHAVYLLKSRDGGTCLIDAGTKDSAKIIYEKLITLDAWPLKRIIITHSHWDHTQGIGFLREKAAETESPLEVFASEKAGPFLADQSFNIFFSTEEGPYDNIDQVLPLRDGQSIEVGRDLTIQIIGTPGHMADHISVWDENTGNIIVGDAFGMKWGDDLIVPNPNSPFWSEKDFRRSMDLLKSLEARTICLAHFGCLSGSDAQRFPDDSLSMYERWMEILSQNSGRLEDIPFLVDLLWEKIYHHIPKEFRAQIQPGLTDAMDLAARAYAKQHP
ncbi:MAG: MBL fold metallo-hydrolase [Deltaproteobacteria bacterium]|nr:MBL fold metallo-hydrolase [Deltaproteobacteria bacterium]